MLLKALYICMLPLYFTSVECQIGKKLSIIVLYESMCPDSLQFINGQLFPIWNEIAPYIDLTLVPFGKSSSSNNGQEFKCQHGPMECIGNKLQSCALNGIENPNAQMHFVHCFMNSFSENDVGQSCATKIGLNWQYVDQCYRSQTGTILQLQAENITKSFSPKFIPTIIYNGVYDEEDQNLSLYNFKEVVCKHLNKVYGGICEVTPLQIKTT